MHRGEVVFLQLIFYGGGIVINGNASGNAGNAFNFLSMDTI
jgi:hypothetical protein